MEFVLRLRDLKLLQGGSIKLLARRRRRLGVDLAMGRAPVAVALVETQRTMLRRAVGVACGVGVARLLVARSVAVPAVVVVERRFLWLKYSLIWLRGRYHGRAAHDGPMRVETLAAGRYHGERAAHDGPVHVETLKRRLRSRAVAAST